MEIANVEAFEAWDGQEGDDWTENADALRGLRRGGTARSWSTPRSSGSGTGCSTSDAAPVGRAIEAAGLASEGSVLGIDLSVADARLRADAGGGRRGHQRHLRAGRRPGAPVRARRGRRRDQRLRRHVLRRPRRRLHQHRRRPPAGRSPRDVRVARAPGQRVAHHHPWRPRPRTRARHATAGRPHALLAGRSGSRAGAPHRRRVRRDRARTRRRADGAGDGRRRGVRVLRGLRHRPRPPRRRRRRRARARGWTTSEPRSRRRRPPRACSSAARPG